MRFREVGEDELKVLEKLNQEFSIDLKKILGNKFLVVSLDGRKEIFAVNKDAFKVLQRLDREPYSIGLYIGEIRGGMFILGLEGASMIAPYTNRRISVDTKTEQLVLYGRDVFSKSVVNFEALKQGDRYFIVNEKDEVIGIGRVEKKILKNLIDRGWYLRKGE